MNYIKELNAFKDWLLTNEIPTSAIVLWYTLMAINNSVGWKSRFNAPNSLVEQLTGLSKQGLLDARKKLVIHNLINCEKGKKGKAPIYEMVSLVNSLDQSAYQSSDQSIDQSLNIPKQKRKQKETGEFARKENPFSLYEQNFGQLSPIARDKFIGWCDELGDDIMISAIKLAKAHGGRTFRYIENILREWTHANLRTLADVRAYEKQKTTTKNNTIPFRKQTKNDRRALFAELRKEAEL